MYDIAIIGAGPSGASLARLIGNGYKVLLLDRRRLDREPEGELHRKCCGGLLAPDAQKVIAELGLGLPGSVLTGPQLFVVRTIDLKHSLERYYQRFYINVDRERLDRWFATLMPGRIDARFGALARSVIRADGHFKVVFNDGGREYVERAKAVVGADGAASATRRLMFGGRPSPHMYVAIQEWYEAEDELPYFSAVFDDDITDYYSWTIPKDGLVILGSALKPGRESKERFELLKERLNKHGLRFGKPVKREGALILRPTALRHITEGEAGLVLTGEAAGFISPSSSEGLSYALRSAMALAEALGDGLNGFEERYRSNCASLRRNIFMKNAKAPFMYNPVLRSAVMKAGVLSVRVKPVGG